MRHFALLGLTLTLLCGCTKEAFWSGTEKTRNFVSDNVIIVRPENPYIDKRRIPANLYTIQAAQKKRQEISYDPYYPMPKPWSEKPEAGREFEATR